MPKKKNEHDSAIVFRVAHLFFQGMPVREIAETVNSELRPPRPLTRESVYPILAEARRLQFVRLVAPLEENLAKAVAQKFGCSDRHITVVRTQGKHLNEYVAAKAAEVTLDLMRAIGGCRESP